MTPPADYLPSIGDVWQVGDYGSQLIAEQYCGNAADNVIIDSREPSTIHDAFAMKLPLYGGDFFWISELTGKPVIVERKQLSNGELLRCLFMNQGAGIYETKLTTQARKMNAIDAHRFLLVELGYYKVDAFTGNIVLPKAPLNGETRWPFKWVSMQKAVRSLCETWDLYPWYAPNSTSTLANIKAIKEHTNKDISSTQRYIDFDPKDSPKYGENISNPVQALCCTDGIGVETARALLAEFRSLKAIAVASADELMTVEGIGKTKAEAVMQLFGEGRMLIINDDTSRFSVKLHHWSHSQDSDFRRCKRKWWLSRALGLEKRVPSDPLYRGTAVHHALQHFHSLPFADRSLDVLKHYFCESYNASTAEIHADRKTEVEEWRDGIGMKTMEGIWQHYGIDEEVPPTTMTEFDDEVILPGTDVPHQFRLDGLIFDKKTVIFETKTSGSKYESDWIKFMMYDLQGPRNLWALNRALGTSIETVQYNFITYPGTRTKKILLLRHKQEITPEQQLASVYDIPYVIGEAERDDLVIYPTFNESCKYTCDFSEICLLKKFNHSTDNVIKENFKVREEKAVILTPKGETP